jgi:plasmid stabilization system protein ParE
MKWQYALQIREEAEEDIDSAVIWYLDHYPDRLQRFLAALDDCFRFIQEHPFTPAMIEENIRQFPLRSFPYFVVYSVLGREVLVVRVFHMSRDDKTKILKR